MKVIGLIGGMSWKSTVTYYQIIKEEIKNRLGGKAAGADFLLICTNAMHKVAPQIASMVQLPIIHIADATADELEKFHIQKFKIATLKDYNSVKEFYYSLIDAMNDSQYKPGWKRDIYPTQEFLFKSIENHELYMGEINNHIVSCMIVNHEYNDGYKSIAWSIEATDLELFVIHALGVHPTFSGKGIAKQMVQKVIDMARENHIKTIRLDVLGGNVPAEKVYTKMGFVHLDTIQMFYEDTGWTNYKLFEFIV